MYDYAIVGGGTVGLYIASRLPNSARIAVIVGSESKADTLGRTPAASRHRGVLDGWMPGLGGTSRLWGGQLWPWHRWEVEGGFLRDAWPIDYEKDLRPQYAKVLINLGLATTKHAHAHAATELLSRPDGADSIEIRKSTWMAAATRNMLRNEVVRSSFKRIEFIHGHVVRVHPDHSPARLTLRALAGGERDIVAHTLIFAAGTLGNVRLARGLLEAAGNLGEVGRYFGDHLSTRTHRVKVTDWSKFLPIAAQKLFRGGRASVRLASTSEWCHENDTMPAYGHFELDSAIVDSVRNLIKRPMDFDLGNWKHSLRRLPLLVLDGGSDLLHSRRPLDRQASIYLRVDVEQPFRRESRISWDANDNLELNWLIGAEERRTASQYSQLLLKYFPDWGIEPIASVTPDAADIYHLMGGTRMGQEGDPTRIVDSDLQVVSRPNIFIAGASVFPSGGMANPTFTALALGNRLAEYVT